MLDSNLSASINHALDLISDGVVVGLGSGRAATAFIHALGDRVKAGLQIRAVPTSEATAGLAFQLGIPLVNLEEVEVIDIAVDGADEVDPSGNLIKGYGGALVREKVVAEAARKFVVLAGPEKRVPILGTHGILPVEVIPFAVGSCSRRLAALGYKAKIRAGFVSDNGNPVLDCEIDTLPNPCELEKAIMSIPGVVGTGLFLGMNPTVLIG